MSKSLFGVLDDLSGFSSFLVNVVLHVIMDLVQSMDHEIGRIWGVGWPNMKMYGAFLRC